MASGDGVITRKDIITDEALSFGKEYRRNVDEAIQANDELIRQFKELNKVTGDYRKAQSNFDYKKAKQEEAQLNQEILNLIKQMEHNEKALERIKQEKLKTEREMFKVAQENIRLSRMQTQAQASASRATMEQRVQQQLANRAERQAVLERMGLVGAYQRLNAQRTEAKKRLQDLIAAGNASNAQLRRAQREFEQLDKKVKKADSAVGDFSKNVGNYKSALSGLSSLMGAFGFVGGVTGAVMLGKSIYETTKQIQAQEIALRMLSETEQTYTKNKEFLIRISEQYGLELMSTTDAYKNYFASAKTSIEEGKMSFEDMQKIFEKVSKSASMLGLSVEQQEGAFLAISQMMSKGTVQSEELRGQLGERLPGAFEVMAKALNVTTMELGKMLQNGEVLAADVLPKFADAYEKAIGADQIERTETLAAAQNRATNKWTEFVESLNSGQGAISKAGMGFFNLTSGILDLINAKKTLSEEMFQEQVQLNILIAKITDVNVANDERERLIHNLKKSYPGFISMIENEDFTNANLLATLNKVNDSYRERIRLQQQLDKLEVLTSIRDSYAGSAIEQETALYEKLIEIQTKHNINYKIDQKNIAKSANDFLSVYYGRLTWWERKQLKLMKRNTEFFQDNEKSLNSQLKIQEETIKGIELSENTKTQIQGEELRRQQEINNALKERLEIAKKLGGVSGKDFVESDLESINAFISKKNSGGGKKDGKKKGGNNSAKKEAEKALREAERLEAERLRLLKDAYTAEIDLEIWRAENLAEINKAESINEKNTQDERYGALIAYQKAEEEALKLNVEKQLTLSRSFQKDKESFTDSEISDMINNVSVRADITNEELLILEKYYAALDKLRKDNQKGIEENIKFEVEQIKKKIQEQTKSSTSKNFNSESAEINKLNVGNNLTDVANYEKAVYEIKRKYLLKNLEDELAVYNKIIESERAKGTVTQEILDKQLELENSIREFKNESHNISLEKAKEMEQKFIEMGANIKNALVDLTNAIFDNRIQRIEEDIERSNEYYEAQIENYEGDAERQKLIREEQEREREKLEAKKRKERHKQAVYNKAMSVMDIGFSTAMAIMQGYAQLGPVAGSVAAVLIGILGTIQTAAVLATPIPKYKMGRKGGPEEFAIVGDGGVHEVIEHKDGSAEITPRKDTLVKLLEGDTVHSSLEMYRRSRRAKINNDLYNRQQKFDEYNAVSIYDNSILEKEIRVLQDILKKKNLTTTVHVPKVDVGHLLWIERQRNW